MSETFREINFSPFAHNVLDYIGVDLVTINGHPAKITRNGMGFDVWCDGKIIAPRQDNLGASYALNMAQVGIME